MWGSSTAENVIHELEAFMSPLVAMWHRIKELLQDVYWKLKTQNFARMPHREEQSQFDIASSERSAVAACSVVTA